MKLSKQTVYLEATGYYDWLVKSHSDDLINHVKQSEGYFFTPAELNDYINKIIRQSLEIASNEVRMKLKDNYFFLDKDDVWLEVDKESITKNFEEIYNKFKV